MSDDEREHWEERAAIAEYDAGMTRADAERWATEQLLQKRAYDAITRPTSAFLESPYRGVAGQ